MALTAWRGLLLFGWQTHPAQCQSCSELRHRWLTGWGSLEMALQSTGLPSAVIGAVYFAQLDAWPSNVVRSASLGRSAFHRPPSVSWPGSAELRKVENIKDRGWGYRREEQSLVKANKGRRQSSE
jgi:hypothetical protein